MAIAEVVADPVLREQVDQYIKVGLSPRQAHALIVTPWTMKDLQRAGFTPRQVRALWDAMTVADLIRKGGFSRPQAEVIARYNL